MKSKKKFGLNNLESNLILKIAKLSNLILTETAKLNLTNNNREKIREQKIKERINNLNKQIRELQEKSREVQEEINEAKNENRLGRAYIILQNKNKINNKIRILKNKSSKSKKLLKRFNFENNKKCTQYSKNDADGGCNC